MEAKTIGKTLQTMNLGKDLQKQQSDLSTRSTIVENKVQMNLNGELGLSLYQDTYATPDNIASAIKRLRGAFPKMGGEFFDILYERIDKNKFTKQRLEDAVNNVLDNFRYKELNVADIVSYDKRVRLYTYTQICDEIANYRATTDDYERVERAGKNYWVKKVDIENAKI